MVNLLLWLIIFSKYQVLHVPCLLSSLLDCPGQHWSPPCSCTGDRRWCEAPHQWGREGGEDTSLVLSQPASVRYRDDEAAVSLVPGQHQLLTTSQPQPQLQSGRVKHQPSVLDVCVGENHNRAGLTALSSFVCLTAFTGLDCTVHTSHHRPESRGKFLTDLLPNTRERVESFCKEEENLNKNKIPSEEWSEANKGY